MDLGTRLFPVISTHQKVLQNSNPKKYYYVQVRTYKTIKGIKYYSGWSSAKKVKTK